MARDLRQFEWIVDHELSASIRHRRCMTMVMLAPENAPVAQMRRRLDPVMRRSDQAFDLPDATVVVMGETPPAAASFAIERFVKTLANECDVRCALAAFPDDGQTLAELVAAGRSRLQDRNDPAPAQQ